MLQNKMHPMDDPLVIYTKSRKKNIAKGNKNQKKTGSKTTKNVNTKLFMKEKY